MVKTPPQQQRQQHQQQQQQQQPAQRQKRKKVAFKAQAISLVDPSAVPAVKAITLADPTAATVLDELCQEQWDSDASTYTYAEDYVSVVPFDERTVSLRTKQLSSKVTAWELDSDELDPENWTLAQSRKRPVKERIQEPKTYASRLKGSVPGPSAKPLEQLRFIKRNNNTVRRYNPTYLKIET
jgi:hypothetical protein